jgi:hypothetical protein
VIEDAHKLAQQYTETSLYRALRFQLQALATEANARDTADPYEITKLRGVVETCTRVMSAGFLIQVAQTAILMREQGDAEPKAPANPPMAAADWWTDPTDLVM